MRGPAGSRVQAVVNEQQGEKIDIIPWSADAATFIVNALQPAEVMKVVLDETSTRIEVVVPDDQLSLAIGRRGQNVRLASQLTGWDIDILTKPRIRAPAEGIRRADADLHGTRSTSTRRSPSFWLRKASARSTKSPMSSRASWLRLKASTTIRRPKSRRARRASGPIESEFDDRRKALGVSDDLKEIAGLTTPMLVKLGENGVKTLEDLADCASDDLVGWMDGDVAKPGYLAGFDVSRAQADAMILDARVRAGWIERGARAGSAGG